MRKFAIVMLVSLFVSANTAVVMATENNTIDFNTHEHLVDI